MDGHTVVEQIRAGASGGLPCFIATSGFDQHDGRTRATASGFDHYWVKPLALAELLALIDRQEPGTAR